MYVYFHDIGQFAFRKIVYHTICFLTEWASINKIIIQHPYENLVSGHRHIDNDHEPLISV